MNPAFWTANLLAYSLQIAALAGVAALTARCLRLRNPAMLYRGWQFVLLLCLAIPFLQPRAEEIVIRTSLVSGVSDFAFRPATSGIAFAGIAFTLLLLGMAGRLCFVAFGLIQLRRLKKEARKLDRLPDSLSSLTRVTATSAGIYLSPSLTGAVSFGIRKPSILLPERFPAMDTETQKAVLSHELLHVQRRDWAFAVAEELVRCVLWFHPAIRWVVARIQLYREQVVDREVVHSTANRDAYLAALLDTAARQVRPGLAVAPTFARTRHLHDRVALILKEDVMSKKRLGLSAAVATCALAMTVGWAAWAFPLQEAGNNWRAAAPGKVYRVGDGTAAPRIISKLEPQYTQQARDAKLQGAVILDVEIGAHGLIQNARVRKGLGMGLDENAIAAIQQWSFVPGMRNGQPVAVSATIEVNYRLL